MPQHPLGSIDPELGLVPPEQDDPPQELTAAERLARARRRTTAPAERLDRARGRAGSPLTDLVDSESLVARQSSTAVDLFPSERQRRQTIPEALQDVASLPIRVLEGAGSGAQAIGQGIINLAAGTGNLILPGKPFEGVTEEEARDARERLQEGARQIRESLGVQAEQEGGIAALGTFTGRLAFEGAAFVAPGTAVVKLGQLARVAQAANAGNRVARTVSGVSRIAGASRAGAIGVDIALGAPIDAAIAAASAEESIAGFLAEFTGSDGFRDIADDQAARVLFEVATGAFLGSALHMALWRRLDETAVEATSRLTENPIRQTDMALERQTALPNQIPDDPETLIGLLGTPGMTQVRSAQAAAGATEQIALRADGTPGAVVRAEKSGITRTFSGTSHLDAATTAQREGFQVLDGSLGYITNHGNIITRAEGLKQIDRAMKIEPPAIAVSPVDNALTDKGFPQPTRGTLERLEGDAPIRIDPETGEIRGRGRGQSERRRPAPVGEAEQILDPETGQARGAGRDAPERRIETERRLDPFAFSVELKKTTDDELVALGRDLGTQQKTNQAQTARLNVEGAQSGVDPELVQAQKTINEMKLQDINIQSRMFHEELDRRNRARATRQVDTPVETNLPPVKEVNNTGLKLGNEVNEPRQARDVSDLKPTSGLRRFFQRNRTRKVKKEGLVRKIERDGKIQAEFTEMRSAVRDFNRSLREVFGRRITGRAFSRVTTEQLQVIDDVIKGQRPLSEIDPRLHRAVRRMRSHVDTLSQRMIELGIAQGDLKGTISDNIGFYLNRSYQVHVDPKWASKIDEDVWNRSVSWLRREYPELTDSQARAALEVYLNDQSTSTLGNVTRGLRVGGTELSITKQRKGIPQVIRDLLGEIRDPLLNYTNTVWKQSMLIENSRMVRDIVEGGLGHMFQLKPDIINGVSFTEPLFRSPTDPTLKLLDNMLGDHLEAQLNNPDLRRVFTTPEIAVALREAFGGVAPATTWYGRTWYTLNGAAKFGKTVLAPQAIVRNFLSNTGFAIANGHWNPLNMGDAIRGMLGNTRFNDTTRWREFFQDMQRLGVVSEGAVAGELRAAIGDIVNSPGNFPVQKLTRAWANNLKSGATALYRAGDDVWKIYGFLGEFDALTKALPELSADQVRTMAARRIQNVYPNYGLVPRSVQSLRRFPLVGTFVSFSSEVFRTGWHTMNIGVSDLKTGLRTNNNLLALHGMKRLAGLTMAVSATAALTSQARFMLGIDKKQDKAFRSFLPKWSQDSQIYYLGNKLDDTEYIDVGYVDPYAHVLSAVRAFWGGENWEDALEGAMLRIAEPFVSEDILAERLIDIARGTTREGRQIFNPEDSRVDQAMDKLGHVLQVMEPGFITSARKIVNASSTQDDPLAVHRDPKTELLAVFTGQRRIKFDLAQSFDFRMRDISNRFNNSRRQFTRIANMRRSVTEQELRDAYREAESSREEIFQEAVTLYQNAKILGQTDAGLGQILLESSGLSGTTVADIRDGIYFPYEPTETFLDGLEESLIAQGRDQQAVTEALQERREIVNTIIRERFQEIEGRQRVEEQQPKGGSKLIPEFLRR